MKNILITGASSGLGMDLAKRYAQSGEHVIACGRNTERLNELHLAANNIKPLVFDVCNSKAIFAATDALESLDVVILNAGDCQYINDVTKFSGDLFANVINTNLISIGYLLEALIPKVNKGGQIVFISSSVTKLPLPRAEAYGASKAGVDYLANSLRLDLVNKGISVTLVHPGFVKTPLTDKNNFAMPFIMSSANATERIYQAIEKRSDYLQFPKRFTYLLSLLSCLPQKLMQKIIIKEQTK